MRIAVDATDEASLLRLGKEAGDLLIAGQHRELAQAFGYAVALGREPATAIGADVAASLEDIGASELERGSAPSVKVKYLRPATHGLLAVIECHLLAENGRTVLLELVVSGKEGERHVSVEQISGAA